MRTTAIRVVAAVAGVLTMTTSSIDSDGAHAQAVDGQLRVVRTIRQSGLTQVAWSPDGRFIAASLSGENPGYAVWDAQTGRKVRDLGKPFGSYGGGDNLQFAPDGKHLLVQYRDFDPGTNDPIMFALWNVETGAIDGVVKGWPGMDNYAVSTAGNRLAVLDGAKYLVSIYDTRNWTAAGSIRLDPQTPVGGSAFAISRDGKYVATGGSDGGNYRGDPYGRIVIYNVETGQLETRILDAHQDRVGQVAFLGAGARLASTARQDGRGGWTQTESGSGTSALEKRLRRSLRPSRYQRRSSRTAMDVTLHSARKAKNDKAVRSALFVSGTPRRDSKLGPSQGTERISAGRR